MRAFYLSLFIAPPGNRYSRVNKLQKAYFGVLKFSFTFEKNACLNYFTEMFYRTTGIMKNKGTLENPKASTNVI